MLRIWTNGTFQNLHEGHKHLIRQALMLTGIHGSLTIGLNSDESIKALGKEVLQRYRDRFRVLDMFLEEVEDSNPDVSRLSDIIKIEQDPTEQIRKVSPDLIVVGDDYSYEQVKGKEFAAGVVLIKRLPGFKTGAKS